MVKYTLTIGLHLGTNYELTETDKSRTPVELKEMAIAIINVSTKRGVLNRVGVEAYTLTDCVGMWQGNAEPSIKVEICHNTDIDNEILALCNTLKRAIFQDCIMLQKEQANISFI